MNMYGPLFIHSSEDIWTVDYLGWLWEKQTLSSMILWGHMFSFFLDQHLEIEWMGHMVSVCLTSEEIAKLLSKVAVPFWIPISIVWGF